MWEGQANGTKLQILVHQAQQTPQGPTTTTTTTTTTITTTTNNTNKEVANEDNGTSPVVIDDMIDYY